MLTVKHFYSIYQTYGLHFILETTQSFYGEESQECLSTAESPDYLNSAQSPGYLNSAESLLSGDSTCSSTIFTFPPTDSCQDTTELVLQDACLEDLDFPITPLIKEEVKMKIKLRRMAEGKEELRVEFKAPEPERVIVTYTFTFSIIYIICRLFYFHLSIL